MFSIFLYKLNALGYRLEISKDKLQWYHIIFSWVLVLYYSLSYILKHIKAILPYVIVVFFVVQLGA
jgi:hypothetical protein